MALSVPLRGSRHQSRVAQLIVSPMKSPDGQYEVATHDYGEVRMGSPEFGRIEIRGAGFSTDGREFGAPMAFSPDSRFLAVEELVGTVPDPHTRAIVFDFDRQREVIVHDQNPGFMRRFVWSQDGLLTIITWSHLAGERERTWHAPPPKARGFWQRIFGWHEHNG
jgi:hypothetical protein